MNISKSAFKLTSANILSSVVSFTAVVVFSRELGASPLGTYYPFLALLGIASIPADFGVRSATEKRLSEGEALGSYLATGIILKLPLVLAISAIIILFRNGIQKYLGADLAVLLVITLLAHEGARLSLTALRGELRVGETASVQILRPLGWLIIGYVLFIQGFGVRGLVYGYLAGTLAMLIVGWWKVSTSIARPTLYHAKSIIEYGRYSFISSIGGNLYNWMDVAILTIYVSYGLSVTRAEVGAYENAWRISLIALMFSRAISKTIFPQVSRWDSQNAIKKIESIIPNSLLGGLLIVIPAFVGTTILSRDILGILFGEEFTVAAMALIILTGEKILQAVHTVLGRSLQAIDRPDLAAYATVAAVISNIALNIILIWYFGIAGAALATGVSFTVNTALHGYYLHQFVQITLPYREVGWSMISALVMGSTVYVLQSRVDINSPAELSIVIIVGVVVYSVSLLSYSPLRKRLISLSNSLRS